MSWYTYTWYKWILQYYDININTNILSKRTLLFLNVNVVYKINLQPKKIYLCVFINNMCGAIR